MSTLQSDDLVQLRQACAREFEKDLATTPINYVKPQANVAFQAIENWFDKPAVKASLAGDIEAASPGVFSGPQKKKLVKFWLQYRFGRE